MTTRDTPVVGAAPLLVLGKITEILDAFSLERPSLTLGQIREATGLPGSTVQRLVSNMVSAGLLERHGDSLRVGLRMAYWAAPAIRAIDMIDLLSPILDDLRERTTESVSLFRVEQHYRVCVALRPTRHELRQEAYVGQLLPLHIGSAGRVLLAWDPSLAKSLTSGEMRRITGLTVGERDELRRALELTRITGFAVTSGERIDGAAGLSVPVFDAMGAVQFSLTISGPALRITPEIIDSWTPHVIEAGRAATRNIGGRVPTVHTRI